jgi:SAM-dependent methyltransferase
MKNITAQELYAQLYDLHVPGWPGEVDFYRKLVAQSPLKSHGVLEIACGTGRITLRLAQEGIDMTGLDISPELLEVARGKSMGMLNVQWVLGDMRAFDIGKKFGFAIIPGHSFQFMITPNEQASCLEQIKRHLVADGLLVIHLDHQDFRWLAGLLDRKEPVFEKDPVLTHPTTNQKFRLAYAWALEPSTQTATVDLKWEEIGENGDVIQVWEMEPMRLHCVFRFEMEHLLRQVGFSIEVVYGDFFKNELGDGSKDMIWLARNNAS